LIYRIFLYFPLFIIIPILIHLLSRRKIKNEPFPSLLFLIERERKLRNYIKFEEILLFLTRCLMIIVLALAGGLVFIPFKFILKGEMKKIYDTSLSTMGRIGKYKYETVNINGIADFEKTFEKYKYGIIVSDMQEINFRSILKKGKRYRYFIPEILDISEENNSMRDILYSFDGNNLKLYIKINRTGKSKNELLKISFDGNEFNKFVELREGDNIVEIMIKDVKDGYHRVLCNLKDDLIFDNEFYKVIYKGKREIKILSDEEPVFLLKALKMRYNPVWINNPDNLKKGDFLIIENVKKNLNLDYISRFCSSIIVSVNDSMMMKDILIKKVKPEFGFIEDDRFFISTEEPLIKEYEIKGGERILNFKDGKSAIVRKNNVFLTSFSLESKELVYHSYYIPFLYSFIERSFTDLLLNLETGDSIIGDFKRIETPQGMSYENIKIFHFDKIGFYRIFKGNDTIFVAVNINKEERNMKILGKDKIDYIFGKIKFYDGTGFFLFIFLILLICEKLLERR